MNQLKESQTQSLSERLQSICFTVDIQDTSEIVKLIKEIARSPATNYLPPNQIAEINEISLSYYNTSTQIYDMDFSAFCKLQIENIPYNIHAEDKALFVPKNMTDQVDYLEIAAPIIYPFWTYIMSCRETNCLLKRFERINYSQFLSLMYNDNALKRIAALHTLPTSWNIGQVLNHINECLYKGWLPYYQSHEEYIHDKYVAYTSIYNLLLYPFATVNYTELNNKLNEKENKHVKID